MRRALVVLFAAGSLCVAGAGRSTSAYVCDQKDMSTLKTVEYDFLWDTPSALNCEFRLFLEPRHPLTWTSGEYFFGGSFWFVFCRSTGCAPEGGETFDMSMSDVVEYYDQIDQHLFWGKARTPDAGLAELKLQRGPIFHESGGMLAQQTYYVFPPQEPGLYRWRYVYDDHTMWSDVARGEICIEPAQPKKGPPPC